MQKSGCTAGCGCTNFKADAFKKEKCCNCFHNHYVEAGAAGGASGVKGPAPPPKKPAEPAKPQPQPPARPPTETKTPPPAEPVKPEEKKSGPPLGKNVLKIAWQQGGRGEYQLDVGDIQNLEQLDARLRRQEASLVGKKFEYLCRGLVVAKAFWDIFRTEYLFPTLYIQEESGDANARKNIKAAIPGSAAEKKSGFVAPTTGAGFAVPTKVTFQKPVVKVVQAPAAAAAAAGSAGTAKVGFKADEAWFAARPALFS